MKRILILIVSLLLLYMQAKSQEILDTSWLECSYRFTLMRDTVEKIKSVRDNDMRLLVGKKYSKFYSHTVFARDSVLNTMTENEKISMLSNGSLINIIQPYLSTDAYIVYTNHIENKIILTDVQPPNRTQYSEDVPKQNWKILNEAKDFNGYKCQKATCTFRGRNYEAWFTREIQIKEGPWKFNGLPGLIVRVYDTQEHYDFELISISKVNRQITFNEQNYNKVNLQDHIKICRYRIQHPLANLMNKGRNVHTTFSPDPKPYDVMERDIK
jgi:GLPGLI family protein